MSRNVILAAPGRSRLTRRTFGLTSALPWGELMVGAVILLAFWLA